MGMNVTGQVEIMLMMDQIFTILNHSEFAHILDGLKLG